MCRFFIVLRSCLPVFCLSTCGYVAKVDSVEHCDKFWYWLQSKGINSNRSGIVNAIAEKVNTWIPGEEHPYGGHFFFHLDSMKIRQT